MAKYSFEFKKKVVKEYLEGKGSTHELAKKYHIGNHGDHKQVLRWIAAYNEFGDDGLRRSRKKAVNTSVEHVKQLEDELLKLRIENAYLKELRRLRLEEEALLKKQRESPTASEENSN